MKTIESSHIQEKRWTLREYDRLLAKGFFRNARVELIEGRIIKMAAQYEPHVASVSLTAKAVERAFGDGFWVRRQNPLRFGSRSKPEPDAAVVAGNENDFINSGTPTTALLVIEVSDSSLNYDRGRKASLYARYGIADYWIVNVVDRQLEVYRDPIADPLHRFRFRYDRSRVLKPGESAVPVAAPVSIAVSNLFPRMPQVT